ncbi:MAG: hypothetical protein JJE27_00700 [Thermoleophilia bacterium]|nr:hypothetical protein [Thermoleophilia bacterium]
MNRKVFAVTALAGLAGLSGVALETRPLTSPTTTAAPTLASPNVETVVIQRTVHIRKRIKRKSASAGSAARRATAAAAPPVQARTVPIAVRPAPVAPRVKTSPSSTGGGEGHESEHEGGDRGAEQDD